MNRARIVLIDGYNLLHAIPRFAPRGAALEPARDALEAWLAEGARRHGLEACVVVWDGRRGSRSPKRGGPLEVLYTPAEVTADDRLLDLCRGTWASRAAETWVVSSDHGVQAPARELGFGVVGAMTFYKRWEPRSGARGAGPASRGREVSTRPEPTRREVDELLSEFLDRREADSEEV